MTTALVVDNNSTVQRLTNATTDDMLIDSWLNVKSSKATQQTYKVAIAQFMAWYNYQPLQRLTVEDLTAYRALLAASDLSAHSQALKLKAIKALLSYGHNLGYLQFDAGKAVKPVSVPNDLAERILEEWQVKMLLAHSDLKDRDRMLLRLLYVSGGRVSEIVGLQWRHVKQNNGSGQITVVGKGSKTRAIKLSVETWKALLDFKPVDAGEDDYVFTSQRKAGQEGRNGQLDRTAINRIVSKAGELIGVADLSPHWFRHAHASHALDKGAPVSLVSATLGHSSVAVTSRYLHAKPGESSASYLGV